MPNGVIKTLTDKGFGFISRPASERDIFFHADELTNLAFDELAVGDCVNFEVRYREKGPAASAISRLLNDEIIEAQFAESSSPYETPPMRLEEVIAEHFVPFLETHGGMFDVVKEYRELISIRSPTKDLIETLSIKPSLIYEITPRRFEEVVADLFARLGYQVSLTGATRDGGKDFYAARCDDIGTFHFAVECKRYAPDRKVGVGAIRDLAGVVSQERLNGGIIVTTSWFTREAESFAGKLGSQIQLEDYAALLSWIKRAQT